jgi:hypothetical protein
MASIVDFKLLISPLFGRWKLRNMSVIYKISLIVFILSYSSELFASDKYKFSSFLVGHNKKLKLKSINYSINSDLKRFKATLEYNIGSPPNYAGTYLITANGCGTMCQVNHVINVKTGEVIDSISSSFGICFSSTSRLLIVNPYISEHYPEEIPEWTYVRYYLLKDGKLLFIDKDKKSFKGTCESGQ